MTSEPEILLEFKDVRRVYPGEPPVAALDGISFKLPRGSFAAVIGPSGSGKSTLLHVASGLDRPDAGEVRIGDASVGSMTQAELCAFRGRHVGFVFQAYNLFPSLNAVENVEYTCLIRGDERAASRKRALEALAQVELSDKIFSFPNQLSGGQQQRVAVARALATAPDIIFADEPTANLDSRTAAKLIELFERINREVGATFLFSTHDTRLVERVRTRLEMRDGRWV